VPDNDPERWRVFIAIEVPDAVRAALAGPLASLEPIREVVRVNAVERIHLTLHFLGHLPRAEVEQLESTLGGVVGRHPRFHLPAEGVGAFPDIRRPRVLWAGITGADLPRLIALQADLGDALRKAGVTIEDRFHPHLTIARIVRPPKATERKLLGDWSSRWGSTSFGEIPVDHVRLMRSQLGAGPPRYTTVATFDLQ
jgi:2'-5' RNA ligase